MRRLVAVLSIFLLCSPAVVAQEKDLLRELELLLQGKVPEHLVVKYAQQEGPEGLIFRTYLLHREVLLSGEHITDAAVRPDPVTGMPEVSLNFDRTGAKLFEEITGNHVRERLAIVLDHQVITTPVIQTAIKGGSARITLGATPNYKQALVEAQDLAVALRAGRLPVQVRLTHEMALPYGTGLVIELDPHQVLSERLNSLLRQFRKELKDMNVPVRAYRVPRRLELLFEFDEPIELKKFKIRILEPHQDLDVKTSESETSIRVGFEASKNHLRSGLVEMGINALHKRLDESGLDSVWFEGTRFGKSDISYTGRVFLLALDGTDLPRLKSLMTREARLEFMVADDRSKTISSLADKLPDGIEMDHYKYTGPNDEVVTDSYLITKGSKRAVDRLVDFLSNLSEIEAFLKKAKVDREITEQVLKLARGGIEEEEKTQILDLVRESLGKPGQEASP